MADDTWYDLGDAEELAKQPLQFIPSKYQDPGFIALPALPSTPPSPTRDGGSAANTGSNSRP